MEQCLPAPPITRSSPKQAGNERAPWRSVRWRLAVKICACCGKEFRPWSKQLPDGRLRVMKERDWLRQRHCSISCSKIRENCMNSQTVRDRVSRALKARGHAPARRGGNGDLTEPQRRLLQCLGPEWIAELAVPVQLYKAQALPKHVKIDIASPQRRIAIELDGSSHRSPARRLQDARKTLFLAQNGWSVLRITNARANELCSTCTSPATLLTSLMAFSSTIAT